MNDSKEANEIAKKQARLTDEQRLEYDKAVDRMMDVNGRVTDHLRLDVINTLLQPISGQEQARQIKEAERREGQRSYWYEQSAAREQAAPTNQAKPQPTATVRDGDNRQLPQDDPMQGVTLHSGARDYGKLQRTHEQVAGQKSTDDRSDAANSVPQLLSKEELQGMLGRYADVRKSANLDPTPAESRERNDLAREQAEVRDRLDRASGPDPNPHRQQQQQQQKEMLDHQHLAEQVGVEARWIGQHVRKQGTPGAESYEREARSAHHTARRIHEQRQIFGAGADRSQVAARVAQQQDQQKQAEAQEAARGNRELTPGQRANTSAEVQKAIDQKERAEGARETGPGAKDHNRQPSLAKSGNSKTGDRSR